MRLLKRVWGWCEKHREWHITILGSRACESCFWENIEPIDPK